MNGVPHPKLTTFPYLDRMTALIFIVLQFVILGVIMLLERRQNPVATDWWRNIQCWVIDLGTGFLFLRYFPDWKGASLIDGKSLPIWIAIPIFLVVRDALEFSFHFAQHRVGFLWRMHSLHHSDPEMSALTTNRHFWGDKFIKAMTIWPLTTLIISQSWVMVTAYAAISIYHLFVHANLKVSFGRFSWMLNSPAYHRIHHSRLPQDYDTNMAALFPIFDVLCGTYRKPTGWPPTGYAAAPERFGELLVWPMVHQDEEAVKAPA